jgi:hypothetical protein
MDSLPEDAGAGPRAVLSRFRLDFHACLTARADELFELADAVLCADGPVRALAGLSLGPEHRRGHGALYDAVNCGGVEIGRLRRSLAGLPLPRAAGGRLVLAVDVSNWLRPGAATSPGRLFCHVYGRGKGQAQMIPGWPYSVVAALESGRTSWTAVLDAVRLGPDDDEAEVTAGQVREVVTRLAEAGHWREGDPPILILFDAGYDVTRLAWLLADLPVELLRCSVPQQGRPAALLWSRLLLATGRPGWHRHGDHLKWLVRAVSAELECGPEGNRETDAGPQVLCRGLLALLMAPHPSRAADDVPDLLDGGVGDGFRDFAGLKLEVSEAAETAEMA